MSLQQLVIVRHGYYDFTGLTEEGKQQVTRLAKVLATKLNGSKVALLSSTSPRAIQTSEILAAHLGELKFQKHEHLKSSGGSLDDNQAKKVIELVEKRGKTNSVVILSTHMEFIDGFPTVWGKTLGLSIITPEDETPKGTARIIDVQTGKVEHIQP